jgi:undecaprenyl phosphate N,N'-diacetylbacillosamine 1-phosphate transferase
MKKAKARGSFYKMYIKRPMDITLSLIALIFFIPVFLVVALLVRVNLGSPVLFKQKRPGLSGKIFKMYKFRTMSSERDENGKLLSDNERLTKFGRFLRSTSLDELPELLNILKGDMSIIGPRPLLVEYLPLYNSYQKRRHEVRPGLSGLAQVNGRNTLTWEDKFELDVEYVDNINFINDIKIILLTIRKVFVREGINFNTVVKDNKFKGTKTDTKKVEDIYEKSSCNR